MSTLPTYTTEELVYRSMKRLVEPYLRRQDSSPRLCLERGIASQPQVCGSFMGCLFQTVLASQNVETCAILSVDAGHEEYIIESLACLSC